MKKSFAVALMSVLLCASVWAQTKAVGASVAASAAPAVVAPGSIQDQNILSVKPDADLEPGYAAQSNGERAKVQPGNNAPMWRQVGSGLTGYSSLPTPEAGNLIQAAVQYPGATKTTAGEAWRQVRNSRIIPYGAALLLIVVVAIALFYWRKGSLPLHGAETGRRIERFTAFERSAHWTNAIAFCTLAISVCGMIVTTSRPLTFPPCRNSTQRSRPAVAPFASGDAVSAVSRT